jgi:uncharacterized spore protein YtfJ
LPERARRIDAVRAATPRRAGAAALLPIEHVVVRSGRGAAGAWASAVVEPYALVVREPGGTRVIAIDATAVSLERLRELIPALDELLASV